MLIIVRVVNTSDRRCINLLSAYASHKWN